jgi:hypothetical protein
MFGYRRGYYNMNRRPRSLVGCGCGGLGLSLLLSAFATLIANLLIRRDY